MAAWYKDETLTSCERNYRSQNAFERDAAKAVQHGWEVALMVDHTQIAVDQVSKQQSAGGGCATALVARLFHPEPAVTATYSRTRARGLSGAAAREVAPPSSL